MTSPTLCPDPGWWSDLLDGLVADPERDNLADHLEQCVRCQQALERLTAVDDSTSALVRSLDRVQPVGGRGLDRILDDLRTIAHTTAAPASVGDLSFLSPSTHPDHLGRLGNYEVLEVIGRGGMGVVLKALDPALDRFVAIKVLSPQWGNSDSARQRFAREGRAMATVRHDHVVAVHAVEEASGLPYLVMEYVAGSSLQTILDRKARLDVEEVVRIGMQTAAGLAAAHAQGLVHRDVKPGNILREAGSGRVKLVDFGLARAVDDASLTQSGVIAGTPHYMAPEQARGETVDERADLFSLGAVMYALCTGQPPFLADSTLAVLRRVCEDRPRPIAESNPDTPDWLAAVVDRLLVKAPARRFASAVAVADLLRQCLAHLRHPSQVAVPRILRTRSRRWLVVCAVVAAAVLVAAGGTWLALGGAALFGDRNDDFPGKPLAGVQAPVAGAAMPWLVLSNAQKTRGLGGRLSFRVDYRFERGGPMSALKYVLVVKSAGGRVVLEQPLMAAQLSNHGTLSGSSFRPVTPLDGALQVSLEAETLAPGQVGWQRVPVARPIVLNP
jgi:serine/threonine-protein kinase